MILFLSSSFVTSALFELVSKLTSAGVWSFLFNDISSTTLNVTSTIDVLPSGYLTWTSFLIESPAVSRVISSVSFPLFFHLYSVPVGNAGVASVFFT